jgi:hypothetical protein
MDKNIKLEKSKREKQIDSFLEQIETQEEYENNIILKVKNFFKDYSEELEDYEYVKDLNNYNKMKPGGYVRYFNLHEELRWGGILIKKIKQNDMDLMVLSNTNCARFIVSFQKNYIFYKHHQTTADKTRKLFMSALEKYTDYK